MRHTLTTILIFAAIAATAQVRLPAAEATRYGLRMAAIPGRAGTMTFTTASGDDAVEASILMEISLAGLYRMESTYQAQFLPDGTLTPISASRTQNERKYSASGTYTWRSGGVVDMDITKSTRPHRVETLTWHGTVRDLCGTFWRLRTLDYPEGEVPAETWALLLDHEPIPVTIAKVERKSVNLHGVCRKAIEVTLDHGGKDLLSVTMSDDGTRLPLLFSLSLPVGTVRAVIEE